MAGEGEPQVGSPTNGDYVPPEFGVLGKEIQALMADGEPTGTSTNGSIKPQKKIKKKAKLEIRDAKKEVKKQKQDALINKLLWRHALKMERKLELGGKKRKKERRKIENPTAKQLQQWNNFASRVAKAKEIYATMENRSSENWKMAMQRAYAPSEIHATTA